ncbi:hypothetical protein [Citrobacter koseri]|nr:hypothetical protein [Citrobacter koseri]QYG86332.1 hypothetical protein NCK_19660 [Citrobacter koseri]
MWHNKYGGISSLELNYMRQFEEKNQWLNKLMAELSLNKAILHDKLDKEN